VADLTLDVWQFVRLMVGIEETLNAHGGGQGSAVRTLYERWEDIWVDLDAQLVDLGKRDPQAFAELMMDQEVVLEDVSLGEREVVQREFSKVHAQIAAQLSTLDDPAEVEDLSFERDELALTIKQLKKEIKAVE